MIYLIGGAPRTGKTILSQQLSATLKVGWTSTDLLMDLLRFANVPGCKMKWDATPRAITAGAEWFFPYLERFLWGVTSLTGDYVIEGVDFLPAHVVHLSTKYPIRAVFLGCSHITLESFTQFPGRSKGYINLSVEQRRQIAEDVPQWSAFIRQEAQHYGYAYVDTASDFSHRLAEAERVLTATDSL